MNKIVLITGATSGFGKAFAEKFAANGYNLVLTGRRGEILKEIELNLSSQYPIKVFTLAFDVQSKKETFEAIQRLPDEWRQVDILINNAGLALGRDYFDEADLEDWETMMNTNVYGLMYVTKAVLPFMIKRKTGHIINIGSISGKEVYEKGNAYCATKHAVGALSEAMRIDLLRHRIRVTAIHPGAAETAFSMVRFKGDEQKAKKVYEGFTPLTAEDVAEVAYFCAILPENVCINDLTMTSIAQANSFYFNK